MYVRVRAYVCKVCISLYVFYLSSLPSLVSKQHYWFATFPLLPPTTLPCPPRTLIVPIIHNSISYNFISAPSHPPTPSPTKKKDHRLKTGNARPRNLVPSAENTVILLCSYLLLLVCRGRHLAQVSLFVILDGCMVIRVCIDSTHASDVLLLFARLFCSLLKQ